MKKPDELFYGDPFEGLPLPKLETPERKGWEADCIQDERGPIWQVSSPKAEHPENFLLSNRGFEQLDFYTSNKLLASLIVLTKENPGRKILVLDIGGGALSTCMRGMLKHPYLKGKIQCINVDLFAQNQDPDELRSEGVNPEDLIVRKADFLEEPILENSVDLVWSYQVLDHMNDERSWQAVEKAASILRPGGQAWLQNHWRMRHYAGPFGHGLKVLPHPPTVQEILGEPSWLQKIANTHNVKMTTALAEENLNGTCHVMGGSRGVYLFMGKQLTDGLYPSARHFDLAYPEIHDAVKSYG